MEIINLNSQNLLANKMMPEIDKYLNDKMPFVSQEVASKVSIQNVKNKTKITHSSEVIKFTDRDKMIAYLKKLK
jgi:hypothetical protein